MFTENENMQELGYDIANKKGNEKVKKVIIITREDHRYDNFAHPPLYRKGPESPPPSQACLNARAQAMNDLRQTARNIVKNI
jgi:hypothetical protein